MLSRTVYSPSTSPESENSPGAGSSSNVPPAMPSVSSRTEMHTSGVSTIVSGSVDVSRVIVRQTSNVAPPKGRPALSTLCQTIEPAMKIFTASPELPWVLSVARVRQAHRDERPVRDGLGSDASAVVDEDLHREGVVLADSVRVVRPDQDL